MHIKKKLKKIQVNQGLKKMVTFKLSSNKNFMRTKTFN